MRPANARCRCTGLGHDILSSARIHECLRAGRPRAWPFSPSTSVLRSREPTGRVPNGHGRRNWRRNLRSGSLGTGLWPCVRSSCWTRAWISRPSWRNETVAISRTCSSRSIRGAPVWIRLGRSGQGLARRDARTQADPVDVAEGGLAALGRVEQWLAVRDRVFDLLGTRLIEAVRYRFGVAHFAAEDWMREVEELGNEDYSRWRSSAPPQPRSASTSGPVPGTWRARSKIELLRHGIEQRSRMTQGHRPWSDELDSAIAGDRRCRARAERTESGSARSPRTVRRYGLVRHRIGRLRHAHAAADNVLERARSHGSRALGVFSAKRGRNRTPPRFINVVVHVFQPRVRDFYRLEDLWGDAPATPILTSRRQVGFG